MIAVIFIFALGGLIIACGVFYACIMLVKNSVELKNSDKKHRGFIAHQKRQTLIDYSTAFNAIKDARNNKQFEEAVRELRRANDNIEKTRI